MAPVKRTAKQREIMGHLIAAVSEGRFLGETDLHRLISYGCSFGALRVSIRFLQKAGMLEKQRAGNRMLLIPTKEGFDWFAER